MKKLFITITLLVVFSSCFSQENRFNIGLSACLPVGEWDDFTTVGLTLDASYLWGVGDSFLVGMATGYQHFFADSDWEFFGTTIEHNDTQLLPIAGSARYYFSDNIFFGADIGYALGINKGNDGGFYYRPKVGYDFGLIATHVSYAGVVLEGSSINFLSFGVEVGL